MEFFLRKIASHILESSGNNPGDQCLVFPNRRAGLYFLKYLSSIAGRPLWAPAVKTINELFGSSSSLKLAETEILVFELYKVYRTLNREAETFDDFYFWGDLLVNDFDDVDKYLADPVSLFENLSDLKKIELQFGTLTDKQAEAVKQFWVNFNAGSRSSEKDDFLKIWSILPELYTGYRKSLAAKGIAYEGMIYREVAERCLKGELPLNNHGPLHFAGFNALNPCEKILLHFLKKRGLAKFYWDYDDSYVFSDTTHSAGYFIRDNLREFGNDMPSGWDYGIRETKNDRSFKYRIIETSSDTGQVKLVPRLLEDLGTISSDEAHHTAIILADESLLVPLLSTIPESVEEVNITMGYPLKFSQVYSLVHHLLLLQKNTRKENNILLFNLEDVINILRHSYYSGWNGSEGSLLERELLDEKQQWIPESRFEGNPAFSSIFRNPSLHGGISYYLKSVLESNFIIDPDDPRAATISLSDLKMRNEFIYRALTALNRLDSSVGSSGIEISPGTWSRLLERIIKGISIPFSGEPLAGIQVMGILETRALDFRNIILLSANEGVLPRISGGSSYIPYSLREAHGLPGIRHQDSIFSYYFHRLLHRAGNVTFVYNSNSEGIKTGEMSRFLLQLNYLASIKPDMVGTTLEIITPTESSGMRYRSEKHQGILFQKYLTRRGKALSPSAINIWLSCRMKFFYRYVCEIGEPAKIINEIDPATFGTLLHKIIQKIYSGYEGTDMTSEVLDSLLKDRVNLDNTAREIMERNIPGGKDPFTDGNMLITRNILANYARMILRYDRLHAPVRIASLEKETYAGLDFDMEGAMHKVNAGGFIDRLDHRNESTVIIDYKTGSITMEIPSVASLFDETDEKRNEAWFQTLMYCELFLLSDVAGRVRPSIYSLRSLSAEGYSDLLTVKGDSKGDETVISDYSIIRKEYHDGLVRTLANIFGSKEPFTMTEHLRKCDYCAYRQLCGR